MPKLADDTLVYTTFNDLMMFKSTISRVLVALLLLATVRRGNTLSVRSIDSIDEAYDFIIVGGGTAGLTIADRLTECPDVSVLVIEYGPFDHHEPEVLVPGLLNLTSTPYLFNVTSVPQAGLNGRSFVIPAGAAVGGSTIVNGMFFDRGAAEDYDAWASLGNPGWDWEGLLPYFKKSENFTPAASGYAEEFEILWDDTTHGLDGPVQSSYPVFQFGAIVQFFSGWLSLGIRVPVDPGDGKKAGVFWGPSSLDPKDETRSYARTAHYDRVIGSRPNYHLISNSIVTKIDIQDGVARGVEYHDRASGKTAVVTANKEVIVSAGAVHSPQILQLSGIGPKNILQKLGLPVFADLPGVGHNLQDHPTLYTAWNFTRPQVPNSDTLAMDEQYAQSQLQLYWESREGPYTIVHQGGNTVAFLPLSDLPANESQIVSDSSVSIVLSTPYPNTPESVLAGYNAQKEVILHLYSSDNTSVQETGWNSGPVLPITLLKPLSRGSVSINTTDPLTNPVVDWASLAVESDIDIFVAALKKNRDLMNTKAMSEFGPVHELAPGANITSDEDIKAAIRAMAVPTYSHPCCSCAMMPEELGGVVGPDLKVYGVKGLRVVDASVMPIIPSAHLSATVYAMAEKAADIIKAEHGL
jgi:choline dehydrogenase